MKNLKIYFIMFIMCLALLPLASAAVNSSSIRAWYNLDYNAAIDATGNFSPITFTGSPAFNATGKNNQSVNFSGAKYGTTTFNTGGNLSNQQAITWGAWVNLNADVTGSHSILGSDSPSTTRGLDVQGNANIGGTTKTFACIAHNATAQCIANTPQDTTTGAVGKWNLVVCTYDGANLKAYINGTIAETTPMTGNIRSSTVNFRIGQNGDASNTNPNMALDMAFIANGAWTASQISEFYNITNSGDSTATYPNFTLISTTPSITFQGQTPSNNSLIYYPNTTIILNTTVVNVGGTIIQSHFLYNASFSLIRQNNQSSGTTYISNFTSLSAGTYFFNASFSNGTVTNNTEIRQVNITNWNTRVNITAVTALGGATISSFDGWVYQAETGLNTTYSTSSGQVFVETRTGNITAWINATGYSLLSNTTLVGFNVTGSQYDQQFRLYETNTLNITFYNQVTPTTLMSGPTITLDLIGSLYANNYSTTNGTMYITLITPDDYTLRYTSTGFSTRFYTVTVTNRSFQSISLYLINNTVSTNLTISVIDEITDPVEGAEVQILKYNLPTNTYILQEIVTTGNDGTAVATVTLNNEYYKFIVVYNGEVKLTTVPEYITSTSKTLQISTGSSFGEEYFDYFNFYKDLTFNNNTNNFRLDYVDGDGVNSQVCMRVSRLGNFTSTLINTSCQTGASGTILLTVSAINGTTYSAYAYFLDTNSFEYYLDSETYTYPSGANVFGTYGLYLQWILTGSMALVGFAGIEFAIISIPVSLWIGNHLGLNYFSIAGINAAIVACLILFFVIILNKRRSA